jgi:hypothetical protein
MRWPTRRVAVLMVKKPKRLARLSRTDCGHLALSPASRATRRCDVHPHHASLNRPIDRGAVPYGGFHGVQTGAVRQGSSWMALAGRGRCSFSPTVLPCAP